jgi:hypothetical protein
MSNNDSPVAAAQTTARAPRLTENRLRDLDLAVEVLDDNIVYLADAIALWSPGHVLHSRLRDKRDALLRARDWIAGKVAAERAHRGDA